MPVQATVTSGHDILPLRESYRREMNCQIVHDSIHCRAGWMRTYLLGMDGSAAGYGSVAIAGPWKNKPTILEFYVSPEHRARAFDLFEAFLASSDARLMEIQSSDVLLSVMLHTYAQNIWSEKIVFHDKLTTALPSNGAVLQCATSPEETQRSIDEQQGGPECRLEVDGATVATGGILFHYNRPYGDIYMEVAEPFRGRGFGSYMVQELKRFTYGLGSIPGARCSPENIASRKTLQKAGFVPCASILNGSIRTAFPGAQASAP